MDVTVVSWNGLPTLRFEDRASYSQNKTKQYDAEVRPPGAPPPLRLA